MHSKMRKSQLREERMGYLLIAPFVILFAIFKLYPMIYGVVVSFLGRNSIRTYSDTTFHGLMNYKNVVSNPEFWSALARSVRFSIVYTIFCMVVGFLMALLLNKKFKGRTAVRTMIYLPYVTNIIAIGIVFKYLLNPTRGPVNAIFRAFDVAGPKWLSSATMALPVSAIIAGWLAVAFNIITTLAALQEVPEDLYEVAKIEGASWFQKLRYVTLPSIKSTLWLLLTITIINSFKNYTLIVSLTNGGPGTATTVLSMQIYNDAFIYSKYSYAAAEGLLMTIFVIAINKIFNGLRRISER